MHTQWRDCLQWKHEGLPLSTSSNMAAKLYDASLTQYCGFYDEPQFGGLASTLTQTVETDPKFVMARVFSNGLALIASARTPRLDLKFQCSVNEMFDMAEEQRKNREITEREYLHALGVSQMGFGHNKAACDTWDLILVDHPTDMLAMKFLQDRSLFMGDGKARMIDSVERVLPSWTAGSNPPPLYGYLLGLYSFTLIETERYERGESIARQALGLNERDSWATHSVVHAMDMTGRQDDGINFLQSTSSNWTQSTSAMCHLNWHDAVLHIEKGDYAEALDRFDSTIEVRTMHNKSIFNLVDACSLLYRLQLEGVDVAHRWDNIFELCQQHSENHLLPFNDLHIAMAYTSMDRGDGTKTQKFLDSLRDFITSCDDTGDSSVIKTDHKYTAAGLAVCEAIAAYEVGDFVTAADLLLSCELQHCHLGGSDAQRDVIAQLTIHAALKSDRSDHNSAARRLLAARKAKKMNSPLTDRLMALNLASH